MLGLLKGAWNQTKDLGRTFMHGQKFTRAERADMIGRMTGIESGNSNLIVKNARERELYNNLEQTGSGRRSGTPFSDPQTVEEVGKNISTFSTKDGFRGEAGINGVINRWSGGNSAMGQDLRSVGLLAATGVVGYQATAGALNLVRGDY